MNDSTTRKRDELAQPPPASVDVYEKQHRREEHRLRNQVIKSAPGAKSETTLLPVQSRRRVLVVDDNRDVAESLAIVLRLWGHDVAVAFDGCAALDAALAKQPELVFLDIGLPRLDGFEVARQMRAHPELRCIRIVAISGYGREEDRRRSREAGIDLHLTKPVDPNFLRSMLGDA